MKPFVLAVLFAVALTVGAASGWAEQPKSKAPDQGYVPEGWYPHEGGLLKYRVAIRFGEEPDAMPDGWRFGRVSAVTTDSQGDVYVFHRGKKADAVVVFDSKGNYLRSWGRNFFGNPHGLRADKDDNIWAVDNGNHQVYKFTREGKLLQTWGIKGQIGTDDKTFNRPTDITFAANGDFFVSDGYGNSRVVRFSKEGKYLQSWGKPGKGPSEFQTVHSIAIDSKQRVYVSDRENNRIQIFDQDGRYLAEWRQFGRPSGITITSDDTIYVTDSESGPDTGAHELPGIKKGIRIGSAKDGTVTTFIEDMESTVADHSGAEGVGVDAKGNVYGGVVRRRMLERHVRASK
jgi:DNA-binding beta-propeller fold protein YncE